MPLILHAGVVADVPLRDTAPAAAVDGTGILIDVVAMQPTLVREPFHRAGWIYEGKYDWRPSDCASAHHRSAVAAGGELHCAPARVAFAALATEAGLAG